MKEYQVQQREKTKVIEVNTKVAKYQGIPWGECSEYQKRKYENFVFLANNNRDKIAFIYV